MLTIQQHTKDNGLLLELEGAATIEAAAQLHQVLLDGLQNHDQVQVDCSHTSSIDIYVLQLLCSAHRSSVAWKKQLTFHGQPAEPVIQAIKNSGFMRDLGCALCPEDVACMWSGHSSSSNA